MKSSIFLLALAVAGSVAWIQTNPISLKESIFRPGVEYVFNYQSQLLTAIRRSSEHHSGLKIHANVRLQILRESVALIKLERIRIYQINDELPWVLHFDLLPEDRLTLITGELSTIMKKELTKPMRFKYEDGDVRDVKSTKSDQLWSINIKKGIISLLVLKLNQKPSTSDPDLFVIRSKSKPNFKDLIYTGLGTSRVENNFKTLETDVNGDCDTKYAIWTEKSSDLSVVSEKVVKKVKDLDKCLNRSSYAQGIFSGLSHLPSDSFLLSPSLESEHVISGDRHHFLIKKALLRARYQFEPYSEEGGQISTHIVQLLQLHSTLDIRTPIEGEVYVLEKLGLKMEIPDSSLLTEQGLIGDENDYKDLIEKTLTELLDLIYPKMKEESATKLMQLNLILKDVPRRQLTSIIKSYVDVDDSSEKDILKKKVLKKTKKTLLDSDEDSEEDEVSKEDYDVDWQKGEILLDLLPLLPTPRAAKVLADLIRDETITGVRPTLSINALALNIKPTPEVVKTLLALYKDLPKGHSTNSPHLAKSLLLAVGTVANRMINIMRGQNRPVPEVLASVDSVVDELSTMLDEAKSEEIKIRIIKTMGNLGARNLIPILQKVILDSSYSESVSIQAIYALRKMARIFDKQVHPLLLSVFLDRKELVEKRFAAFIILHAGHPSFTTMQLLASSLRTEPSNRLKTYAYAHLVNMATFESNVPELEESAKNARRLLKLIPPTHIRLLDSKTILAHHYSEHLKIGAAFRFGSLKSKGSMIPEKIFGNLRANIFGNYLKLAAVGVDGIGIDAVLRRLFGPYGILSRHISIDTIENKILALLKPLAIPKMGKIVDLIKDILLKKNFETKSGEKLHGTFFLQILEQELQYCKVDEATLADIVKKLSLWIPKLISDLKDGIEIDVLKSLTVVANSYSIPTPMGVPLSLNLSVAAILKLNGEVKLIHPFESMSKVNLKNLLSQKSELKVDLVPSVSGQVFAYMGADMRWIRTSTGVLGKMLVKVPLDGKLVFDPKKSNNKVWLKYKIPKETTKLLHISIVPVTVVYHIPLTIDKLPFRFDLKELTPKLVKGVNFEKTVDPKLFGFTVAVKAHLSFCALTWCPYVPLTGKQEVTVTLSGDSDSEQLLYLQLLKKKGAFGLDSSEEDIWSAESSEEDNDSDSEESNEKKNYRLASRESEEDLVDSDLDKVIVDRSILNPRKNEILLELGTKSGKKVKVLLSWIHEPRFLRHQWNIQLLLAPNEWITKPFKLMVNKVLWLEPVPKHSKEPFSKLDIHWGGESFKDHWVKAKLLHLDENTWINELQKGGFKYMTKLPTSDRSVWPAAFRYAIDIEYAKVPEFLRRPVLNLLDLIKYQLHDYLTVNRDRDALLDPKINIFFQVIPKWQKWAMIVKTPIETDFILGSPLYCPIVNMYWQPSLTDESQIKFVKNYTLELDDEYDYKKGIWNDDDDDDDEDLEDYDSSDISLTRLTGICKISSKKVITYDGVPVLLPSPSYHCPVLLTSDCSGRNLFSLVGHMDSNSRWNLELLIPQYQIKMIPSGNDWSIVVNGDEMNLPIKLYHTPEDASSGLSVKVKEIEDGIKIKLYELGIKIYIFDNNKIAIKISPWSVLQGTLCGLCSDYNYDRSEEFLDVKGLVSSSVQKFVLDKIIPSGKCDAKKFEEDLGLRYRGHCKKEVTWIVNRRSDDLEETCFSKRPVSVCKKHCISAKLESKALKFSCLPIVDPKVPLLVEKIKLSKIISLAELSGSDFEESVDIPDLCTCNE